ncbi:MAG: hypothetical protein Devi2KO_20220 [Devosia indica]
MTFDDEYDLSPEDLDYEWLTDMPALLAFFDETRGSIPATFEQGEHHEADAAVALYLQMVTAEIELNGGHLTAATEFLSVMVQRNHLVAVKLTQFLAEKHIKKANGQMLNPKNIVKAWYQFHSEELAHLGKMKRRERIGTAFNVTGPTIRNWIAAAEPLVAYQNAKRRSEHALMMEALESHPSAPVGPAA